ncbi:MAG: protein adenylyltransferase SelO family protein [Aliarcobacter sp.]|nr:protein adenylyltransferase SelO family protein [Aliarcobacter sp.]
MSEAMFGLGIPTTRALGIIDSDSFAHREWEQESCSIVLRMSPSWIRVGTFEFFARSRDERDYFSTCRLCDKTILSTS